MPNNSTTNNGNETANRTKALEAAMFVVRLRSGIWLFGIPSWLFGITDRSFAAFADGYLSGPEVFQLLTTSFFFLTWLLLKPEEKPSSNFVEILSGDTETSFINFLPDSLCIARTRKFELKRRHAISQEYILPFPYFCQIYHLLSLKHLETIHKFSLGGLKILNVSHCQATSRGGMVKFQTILDSTYNPLRIWRQPIVEVDLILHNPYAVELSIPVYNNKRIVVLFHALPLNDTEHHFFVDIYSDLDWPKPLLQVVLHFAACLTLFEDLPYLRALADTNIERLQKDYRGSSNDTMWLFNRFMELYGSQDATFDSRDATCHVSTTNILDIESRSE